ncbi:class I SAM-dependent methyltransferase [Chitinibacter bivalviorum]|uniref:Class I SAM-dependent methyltransferase n=1 Tax=Chitinibacter bivalviorum TaxID=2739434 RepID=A0A7H9BGN7_9NEIS|nr:class I SAM-dependent methyltransferase [Chitinibacter bivalviorum]QLG87755.1 class I SAM-dependent methyltransferase [Chitinibacter bivalviorum]
MDTLHATARQLAAEAINDGRPLDWFETLYAKAQRYEAIVPWADLIPNPNLTALFDEQRHRFTNMKSALKVGCGLGDDAEWLAQQGLDVTAIDIAKTAIAQCLQRFPQSPVRYCVANLFEAPTDWCNAFDLVVEAYTLQVLPAQLRPAALSHIAQCVASNGYLLIVARLREPVEAIGAMPWPLTRAEIDEIKALGFTEIVANDFFDQETPPVRRFRGIYQKIDMQRMSP